MPEMPVMKSSQHKKKFDTLFLLRKYTITERQSKIQDQDQQQLEHVKRVAAVTSQFNRFFH